MKSLFLLLILLPWHADVPVNFAADDPWVGTWKMNVAKSKSDPARPLTIKSLTDVRTREGEWIVLKKEVESTDGRKAINEIRYKLDGQDYAGTAGNTIAGQRVGADELHFTFKREGKVVATSVYKLAPDGCSYTTITKGIDAKGEPCTFVAVMERQ